MRIYAFTTWYPSLYKPYYDAHFGDLLRQGHDLTVFSVGTLGSRVSRKVERHRIPERVRHYPGDAMRDIVRYAPGVLASLFRRPVPTIRAARIGAAVPGAIKQRVKSSARAAVLPHLSPDLCIVHEDAALRLLPWLRDLYPGVPVALYYHGGVPKEAGLVSRERFRDTFRHADVVFTNSRYARGELVSAGVSSSRVHVLPVSFDLEDVPIPADRTYRPGGTLRLLSVGRISEPKGHAYALRALAELVNDAASPPIHYTIVGTGTHRTKLEQMARDHGLEQYVTFAGSVDNSDLQRFYQEADALLLTSYSTPEVTETQGAVIQEAMLLQAMVVTTAIGGVPDSIPPAMRRFHVPERDVAALIRAIRDLISMEEEEMARLGRENALWVRKHFDVRRFNEELLSIADSYRFADSD